jgi:L-malate glycosyltransferase
MACASGAARQEIRRAYLIPEGNLVLGTVGRLERSKGQDFLIEAAAILKRRGVRCTCLIVGDGPYRTALKAKADDLGLSGQVIFTGMQRNISDILSAMDVFILPSTLKEGSPLVLAEAASAALPLVVTDVGGNSEMVKDSINGFIVMPSDPEALAGRVACLLQDPVSRDRMGKESRKIWQESFSRDEMLKKIEKVYEES